MPVSITLSEEVVSVAASGLLVRDSLRIISIQVS